MSGPGVPANDGFVRNRFSAGRGAAASTIDPEVLELAEGGGGAQTAAAPVKPSPDAAPPSAGLPMGLRVQQLLGRAASTVKQNMADSWDTLKRDFIASTGMNDEARKAFESGSFWDQMKSQFDSTLATGKLPLDAFNVVLSPLTGAIDAGAEATSDAVFSVLPEVPGYDRQSLRQALNTASALMAPGKGGLAKAGAARAAAEEPGALAPAAGKSSKASPMAGAVEGGAAKPGAGKAASERPGLSGEGLERPAGAEAAPRPFDLAGERPGAALKITPEIRKQATSFLAGKRADNPIQVSLEGLSADADLNKTVSDLAKMIEPGKVKPDDIREMGAYSLNLQPDELLERLVPQFPSDEMQAAAGMLVNSAGSEFQKFARAAMENPTAENRELAIRAYAQANEIIGRFRDAGTDLGRGLRARQATMGAKSDYSKAIEQIIADVGPENVDEAIRKAATLPDPKTVAPFLSSLRWMGGREGLLFGWYNWLLSNPRTIVSNVLSNTGASAWNVAVRYTAEKFGKSGDIRPGEAAALFEGYVGSMREGLSAAAKALKSGQSQFWGDYQTLDGRMMRQTDNYPPLPIAEDNPTAGALNWLRAALPTSWIGAADDFAKVTNYRAEARSLAFRDGMIKGLSGDELGSHVAQVMNNMPEHLHNQAVGATLRTTFQEPLTGIAERLQDIVDLVNIPIPKTGMEIPFGRLIMPFVKTPANLARFAYHNSALAYAIPSQRIKAELAAGGATRDLALARMGLGTAVSLTAMPFMMGGTITGRGPADPQLNRAWRDAGNRPYSVKVGDTWYGYNRVDPLGLHLGALADTIETMKFAKDADAEQLAWSAAFGMGDALLSKTYLQGMSNFLEALHDPQGEGKYFGDRLVASMALPSGANAIATTTDPWLREHYDLLGTIATRTPGLSSSQPPVRDIWGDPIPRDKRFLPLAPDALARLTSPVEMRPADDAWPIDKWIWENRAAFPDADNGRIGITRAGKVQSFENGRVSAQVELTDQQLDRLRSLAGNELKDPSTGLGARDALNALVEGKYPQAMTQRQWDDASPAARAMMVLRIWGRYRTAAKDQLLEESPDLQATLAEKFDTRIEALQAPTLGEGQ